MRLDGLLAYNSYLSIFGFNVKRGMQAREFYRAPLLKVEDQGNPKFVILIRIVNVLLFIIASLAAILFFFLEIIIYILFRLLV